VISFCIAVAKLSDSPEKNMCDDVAYLAYLRQVFELKH
jgi:nicotinate phosphoribosyltransferase